MSQGLGIKSPTLGWEQILTARQKMLDEFDRARTQARAHEVETYHGTVAEASVRAWLSDFLPKRYGVTSGYIVSPGLPALSKVPHFDVIIYDQLESPVLWVEEDAGTKREGSSLAIPVEYVKSVIEVKSALRAKTLSDAIAHLRDLAPLMSGLNAHDSQFKLYLPREFSCFPLFFELRAAEGTQAVDTRWLFGGQRSAQDLTVGSFCGPKVMTAHILARFNTQSVMSQCQEVLEKTSRTAITFVPPPNGAVAIYWPWSVGMNLPFPSSRST